MGILLKSALNRGGAKPNSNGMTLFYFIALFLKKRRNCLSSVTIRGGGSENCPNWQCHNVSGLPAPCYNCKKNQSIHLLVDSPPFLCIRVDEPNPCSSIFPRKSVVGRQETNPQLNLLQPTCTEHTAGLHTISTPAHLHNASLVTRLHFLHTHLLGISNPQQFIQCMKINI